MNKPAAKEPSMDEILSSIRQIIADEDQQQAAAPEASAPQSAAEPEAQPTPEPAPASAEDEAASIIAEMVETDAEDEEPLTLSTDQMIGKAESPDSKADDLSDASIAQSDDLMVENEELEAAPAEGAQEIDAELPESPEAEAGQEKVEPVATPALVLPDDIAFEGDDEDEANAEESEAEMAEMEAPEPIEATAPSLPNPDLTAQMTEELLEPAAGAAVRSTFSKLNALSLGNGSQTFEAMVKEMMRPMLKAWLDENLPGMVERAVEKEISRLSRGE